ncbi:MAG: SPOR domain-containing protein [Desulforhabdus sp.]|nr:SPOR domain-containing protein [Desulforhabdus sp.]
MASPKGSSGSSSQARTGKRFRIEFGIIQLLIFFLGFFLVASWMFVFGILVGRGLPLAETGDISLRAEVLRFMGLARESSPPAQNAAETWDSPQKILESLNYYESFTNGADPISGASSDKIDGSAPEPKQDPIRPKPPPTQAKSAKQATSEKPIPAKSQSSESPEESAAEIVTERFTLLAASVRDASNAESYAKKLKTKGYAPRLETVDMPESGRWTRVLVGSFDSREEALKFAAEFNRKENMQGLVIRLGH